MFFLAHRRFASEVKRVCLGILALTLLPLAVAQDRDRDYDRDRDRDRGDYGMKRISPGTMIPVRINESIDVERRDNRIYYGIVDQDVRGDRGRVAIPRGSQVELIVRAAPGNDMILDMESVTVNGQRYGVSTTRNRVESQRDNTLVGGIIGAITGGEVRGRAVRIPRDTVITFRLQQPLDVGWVDRGVMRDDRHYHDYYDRPYRDDRPDRDRQ